MQMPLNRLFVNMALRAAAQDMNMVSQSPRDTVLALTFDCCVTPENVGGAVRRDF